MGCEAALLSENAIEHSIRSIHQLSGPVGLTGLSLLVCLHELGRLPLSLR